ncbi:helix-turn-helix domain-containing protein [Kitasatospora sp. NPDC058170]|uniref:helix-turn-helix domain-containing protein n=1 Tax=Kitasatospora sp. NPDC058170 TaxID=3346364 RepID=UPI0036D827BE
MNRAELGAALRALRQASGKEAKAVARSAVMSASKLSKIENGRATPTVMDVDRILTAIGVSAEVKSEYLAAARADATESTAWREFRRLGYHRKQQQIRALDQSMKALKLFQPSLVPGPLQTPEYVRTILGKKNLGAESLNPTITTRLERQAILYDPDRTLSFVITEPVLRWRILAPAMMAGQLDRIISASRLPNVDIRIVPLTAHQPDSPGHSFAIRDDRVVTVETVHAEIVVTDPRDVAAYLEKFNSFFQVGSSGESARSPLRTIRDEYLQEH